VSCEEFLTRLERVKRSGKGWTARCPAHDDRLASLSIGEGDDGRVLVKCHAGCTVEEIVATLGLGLRDLFPEGPGARYPRTTPATVQQSSPGRGCTLAEYAQAKGLPVPFLESLGVAEMRYLGAPAVRLPYVDASGEELCVRFRVSLDGEPPGASHGVDVDEDGSGLLRNGRMHQLVRQRDTIGERTLQVTFEEPGAEAYAFTFG